MLLVIGLSEFLDNFYSKNLIFHQRSDLNRFTTKIIKMYTKRAFYNQDHPQRMNRFGRCKGGHSRQRTWKFGFDATYHYPPANVRELDDQYELYLFAPGYEKGDFIIALIDERLSISVKDKKQDVGEWKRQEFVQHEFVRQFELSEKVDKSAITAKYENGVLMLSLPKSKEYETNRKEIEIV